MTTDTLEISKEDVATLEEAIAKIEAGWIQGRMEQRIGEGISYCITGAIRVSTHSSSSRERVRALIQEMICRETSSLLATITLYNDFPTRKKSEVLAVMHTALAEAKKLAGVA